MRKAVIRNDGFVENIIEIEEKSKWQPPEDCYLIDAGNGSSGDTWDGEKFIKPELIEPKPVRDTFKEIDGIKARLDQLESLGIK